MINLDMPTLATYFPIIQGKSPELTFYTAEFSPLAASAPNAAQQVSIDGTGPFLLLGINATIYLADDSTNSGNQVLMRLVDQGPGLSITRNPVPLQLFNSNQFSAIFADGNIPFPYCFAEKSTLQVFLQNLVATILHVEIMFSGVTFV